ncbi:hypothetical protein NE237_001402 [Protea cynaroides]|uniref:Reverse transcriptase Ty1/copia-type domain-containing protein n=1 Tax=Protea cynaroides TaxID=273540 RepID=A0A9Q0KU36_9MAGN|nr:hypothetical protein NE237_001402 [Protea cynaroides]
MKDEMESMSKNQVWELVELPKGTSTVGCKWVFKTKRDPHGNIERYKARLVAKGYNQKANIDYKETFSPVSRKDSLRIIMALVAHYDLELHQMDVKTAFLNGDLIEEVYMDQPEGFNSDKGDHLVCKLKRSIYGLKQASRQWYLKFDSTITSYGFVENRADQCIYIKIKGTSFTILVLYVDDILIASNDLGMLHETKYFLTQNFDMKDMGEASYVLGIEIHRDMSLKTLGLSQKGYIDKILERFKIKQCSSSVAPVIKGDRLSLEQCPKTNLEKQAMQKIPYASVVGSLMYAQVCTRPDISFAVGVLGRFQVNPGLPHWKVAKKVLRYLQGTKDYMLTYRHVDVLELIGYSDSDYAGCEDTRKSTSGFIFLLGGGAVSWRSVKQPKTASSTMEAEVVACCEAVSQASWLRQFVIDLKVISSIERPIKIYCDNTSAVSFSNNTCSVSRCRHIEIKYFVVKEDVQDHHVQIEYVSTDDMVADPFTKGLPANVFVAHVGHMGLCKSFSD